LPDARPSAHDRLDLDLLRQAGAEAGRIALGYFRRDPQVWMKGGTSPVSEADYAVDRFLRDTLLEARPDYGWLSEETVDTAERLGRRRTFVVDPIDGTRGFLAGSDVWCVSMAVVEDGRAVAGVLDCPARGEVFSAQLGGGSHKNGKPLAVEAVGERPRIAGPRVLVDRLPPPVRDSVTRVTYVPSLAYRIAMIADGTLDATFVKANARDWDLAAADLVLSEAGGALRRTDGQAPRYCGTDTIHGLLVAGSGPTLDIMRAVVAASTD